MPKSRTRRRPVSKARPRRGRRAAPRGAGIDAPTPVVPSPTPVPLSTWLNAPGGPPGEEWDCYRPLVAALDDPRFGRWVDGLPVVSGIDALLGRLPVAGTSRHGELEEARVRALLLEVTCLRCSVLTEDDGVLRPGPGAALWTSDDARVRTWFRAFVVVALAEEVVRSLPGRSYLGEQTTSALAEVVTAAASAAPWRWDDVEARGSALDRWFVTPGVRSGVERLRWSGVLDPGPLLVAPPQGRALLETLARGLEELPVPAPRHPDSRVTGPTYEVEASVDVAGEQRLRLVRVSGGSAVSVLTDVVMTAFGLTEEGATSPLTGGPLWSRLGEAGPLTTPGADRADPWSLAVGRVDTAEGPETANAAVDADRVSVTSLVEHLGERWELPLSTWGGVVEDPVLQLRVVRTVSADDSRSLVFPSCLAGSGDHLAPGQQEDDDGDAPEADDAGAAPFDLALVEARVARLHRGRR